MNAEERFNGPGIKYTVEAKATAIPVAQLASVIVWPQVKALLLLAKPGIVVAELAAALAGLLLTAAVLPTANQFLLLVITVTLAAGGAALANGLLDAERDRQMPRLAARCQALKLVGEKTVFCLASLLMMTSLVLAALYLNWLTALLLGMAIVAYLGFYTAWLKRTSPLALLVGAIPGALPPLIGAAAAGSITNSSLLLAVSIYLWQLPHFCFLALQYQEQYRLAGVPVFPDVYGQHRTNCLILLSSASLIPVALLFRLLGSASLLCVLVLLFTGIAWLACNLWAVQQRSRYRHGFLASLVYVVVVLAALMLDVIVRTPWLGDV